MSPGSSSISGSGSERRMKFLRKFLPHLPFIVLGLAIMVAVAHVRWYW